MTTGSANPTSNDHMPVHVGAVHSSPNGPQTSLETTLLPSTKFTKQLNGYAQRSQRKADLVRHVATLLQKNGCRALWIVPQDQSGQSAEPIALSGENKSILDSISVDLEKTTTVVKATGCLACQDVAALPGNVLLGSPICSGERVSDVLVGLYPATHSQSLAFDWTLVSSTDTVSKWQMRTFIQSAQHQLTSLSSFVNMAAAINRTDNQLEASITLVNELKSATGTNHAAVLLRSGRRGPFKLAAMSGVEFFDRNASMTQTIESTVLGCEDKPTFWYQSSDEDDKESHTELKINLQNFCHDFDVAGCAVLPLKDNSDELFGWLLLSMSAAQCNSPQTEKHFRQISSLVAGQLDTVLKAQRTMRRVCVDNTRKTLKSQTTKKLGIAALLISLILCIPFPYKIGCDCQLQLTSRRFVAAPYDGMLQKTLVSSGDIVTEGQAMARMDAGQLRMEMSGLMADLESERKKGDSALARGSVAESQIAKSEMARLESRISILAERLENTEIRSPISGVVVSGDMDKAEGAPLELGQNLFEVGPLEQMLVEINIPESEIKYASKGMKVRFEFDAFPFDTFAGTIQRIHPRPEIMDSESVFVAEVSVNNESGHLRPGMKGRAKIVAHRYPLGWNLFHGAIEKARHWLVW